MKSQLAHIIIFEKYEMQICRCKFLELCIILTELFIYRSGSNTLHLLPLPCTYSSDKSQLLGKNKHFLPQESY